MKSRAGRSSTKPATQCYAVRSLEAALWSFYRTDSFEAAIVKAANLGDDADTTAAICGQLAGAFYGESGIPKERDKNVLVRRVRDSGGTG